MKKSRSIKIHAKNRFKERVGKKATDKKMADITSQIREGAAKFICDEPENRVLYDVYFRKNIWQVIWDKEFNLIVTLWKKNSTKS